MTSPSWQATFRDALTREPPSVIDDELKSQAFSVLVDAVRELGEAGTVPTASQVRLAMKRRTYGGFDPGKLGYKRFRDFLSEAASENLIDLDEDRPGDGAALRPDRGADDDLDDDAG